MFVGYIIDNIKIFFRFLKPYKINRRLHYSKINKPLEVRSHKSPLAALGCIVPRQTILFPISQIPNTPKNKHGPDMRSQGIHWHLA